MAAWRWVRLRVAEGADKKVVKKELEGYRELRRTYGKQALSEEFAFFFRNDPLRAELDALPPVKREIKRMTD